jgi:hypothetical protein
MTKLYLSCLRYLEVIDGGRALRKPLVYQSILSMLNTLVMQNGLAITSLRVGKSLAFSSHLQKHLLNVWPASRLIDRP